MGPLCNRKRDLNSSQRGQDVRKVQAPSQFGESYSLLFNHLPPVRVNSAAINDRILRNGSQMDPRVSLDEFHDLNGAV